MLRRLFLILCLTALPVVLTGCPDDDTSIEEGMEEMQDEMDDAL